MKKKSIIIDTDPGVDDAMALLFAILSGFPIKGISTVYGNATIENVTHNALMLLEFFQNTDIPVFRGADTPLIKKPVIAECHGTTGLGNFSFPLDEKTSERGEAYDFLRDELMQNDVTLLCLGPLTNIAKVLSSDPSLASGIDRIIFLGGGFGVTGNISPVAEFNVYNDPEALDVVLRNAPGKIVIIPLEVCRKVMISTEEFEKALSGSPARDAVHSIVDTFIAYYKNDPKYGGFAGGVMYDLLIAGYYLFPDLFTVDSVRVAVETDDGEMRGKTSFIKGEPNALVARDVDASRLKNEFLTAIGRWNPSKG